MRGRGGRERDQSGGEKREEDLGEKIFERERERESKREERKRVWTDMALSSPAQGAALCLR